MNNAKQNEVLNSVLYSSASDEDKAILMNIAKLGDEIAKRASSADITEELMGYFIKKHLGFLESLSNKETQELLCKASYAEAVTEKENVEDFFGCEVYYTFITGLREIGNF